MALTVNSKIKELMANEECLVEVDRICPGLTTHPHIGLAKNFTLKKCASLLPEQLTPEVMTEIAAMLERVTGKAEDAEDAESGKKYRAPYWNFDEVIDREGTNSVKYGTGNVLNPHLPDSYIPMWIADMDFACPQPVLDAMKERLDRKILGYSMALDPGYYAAAIEWEKTRHGADVSMDQIVFSGGVIRAMEEAVRHLTSAGDSVLLNTPSYHPFDDSIKLFGRTPVYSTLCKDSENYYTYDWDDLEKKAADPKVKLFFLCNPHNPTGRVWTPEELRRVADIMFAHGVFIFCDEIWRDHVRCDMHHTSLTTLYPGRSGYLVATAPSKTFNLAGNHLANLIIPDRTLANEWTMNMYCGQPNPLSLDACRAAYEYCADWVDAMKAYIDGNFAYMDAYLKENLPDAVFRIPQGTYLGWVDMRAFGLNDAQLNERISRAGLFIEFGNEFVRDGDGFVRINVACPRSVLKKALRILCAAMGDTRDPDEAPAQPVPAGRLAAGDRMPGFTFDTPYAQGLSLADAVDEGGAVLALLRYAGCPLCQMDIVAFRNDIAHIGDKGAKLLVVLQSTPESVREQLGEMGLPFTVICDPEGSLYEQLCVRAAPNKLALAGGISTIKRLQQAKKAGIEHGAYEGEELQLPAVFIVDRDLNVRYAHYAKNVSDMPTVQQLGDRL